LRIAIDIAIAIAIAIVIDISVRVSSAKTDGPSALLQKRTSGGVAASPCKRARAWVSGIN
jgi:hypothetical protein